MIQSLDQLQKVKSVIMNKFFHSTAILAVIAAGSYAPAHAQSYKGNKINSYTILENHCDNCSRPNIHNEEEAIAFLKSTNIKNKASSNALKSGSNATSTNGAEALANTRPAAANPGATQVVFLNFVNDDPTFPVCRTNLEGGLIGLFTGDVDRELVGIFNDYIFSRSDRNRIQANLEEDFEAFNFEFTQKRPSSGQFTTINIGLDDTGEDCVNNSNIRFQGDDVGFLFGAADNLDSLNRDRVDSAFVDSNVWTYITQLDGDPFDNLQRFTGLNIRAMFSNNLELAVRELTIRQTSNTTAHELGHTLGLRHAYSIGAPGTGIAPGINPRVFVPVFDGPREATETRFHTMASGASVGITLRDVAENNRFFSERSAVVLAINENPYILSEERIRRAGRGDVNLRPIAVPNTILNGKFEDSKFEVEHVVIEGDIDSRGEVDSYFFRGRESEFFNLEVFRAVTGTEAPGTTPEGIIAGVSLYLVNDDGSEELIAENDVGLEGFFDTNIFDAQLPETGRYRMQVNTLEEINFTETLAIPISLFSRFQGTDFEVGPYTAMAYTAHKPVNGNDLRDTDEALNLLRNYNAIAFENLRNDSAIGGRSFVGGDLSGSNASFGRDLNLSRNSNVLLVEGNITGGTKNITRNGNVRHGGSAGATINTTSGNVQRRRSISTDNAENVLKGLSSDLFKLESNSQFTAPRTNRTGNAEFTASPDRNGVAVFNIRGGNNILSNDSVRNINIDANGAQTIVINIGGKVVNFDEGRFTGGFVNNNLTSRIIWNFHQAERVNIENDMRGTILAPEADVRISADVRGPVIAENITISGGATLSNNGASLGRLSRVIPD